LLSIIGNKLFIFTSIEHREGLPKKVLDISAEFSDMNYSDLRRFLRQKIKEDPFVTFSVIIGIRYKNVGFFRGFQREFGSKEQS